MTFGKQTTFIFFVTLAFCLIGCGNEHVTIDREQGVATSVGAVDSGTGALESRAFFDQKIFPLLTESIGGSTCSTSGCHLASKSAVNSQTFFQIDPASTDISWNWAQVRRVSVEQGEFAGSSSETLNQRVGTGGSQHNSAGWSAAQRALVTSWSELSK